MKPDILLLDEPAAGMNPNETMQLLSFVRMLNGMGYTIVVIEHDMKFIMNLCNRIMVLNYGKKLFSGTPEEVKNNDEVIDPGVTGTYKLNFHKNKALWDILSQRLTYITASIAVGGEGTASRPL